VRLLATELTALIHHVELNTAGWRDRAADEMILSVLYLAPTPLSRDDIKAAIVDRYGLSLTPDAAERRVESLVGRGRLVRLPANRLTLAAEFGDTLARRVAEGAEIEQAARQAYETMLRNHGVWEDATTAWSSFNHHFLFPLVCQLGARTYELLAGERVALPSLPAYEEFVKKSDPEVQPKLRAVLVDFFSSSDRSTRSHILRHLSAYFLLQACHLSQESVQALASVSAADLKLTVFLDTNFLFSILGLHDNPSNEAAQALYSLVAQVSPRVRAAFKVLPDTIDETRRTLAGYERRLADLQLRPNMATAVQAMKDDFSGITNKFFEAAASAKGRLTAREYFEPYADSLVPLLRSKGVELHNADTSAYGTRQDVVDDILDLDEFEKRAHPDRPKTYEAIRHDVILWHFTNDRRPSRVDSPLDAGYWVATVDFRFIGFDRHKRRSAGVPVCVHPTILIHMLQFWIGRTPAVETAILESLLPMLPRQFDVESERVTISILKALSRFEDVEDLSSDSISSILVNKALRQRINSETPPDQVLEAVRDAVIHQAMEAERQRDDAIRKLAAAGEAHRVAAERIDELERERADAVRTQGERLSSEALRRRELEQRLSSLEDQLRERDERRATTIVRAGFGAGQLALLAAVTLLATATAELVAEALGLREPFAALGLASLGLLAWALLSDLIGTRLIQVNSWLFFKAFRRVARGLYWVFGTIVVGVLTTYVAEQVLR